MANANGPEVAKAYVTIIPSMQGAQQTIAEELGGAAAEAGAEAGSRAGTSLLTELSNSLGDIGSTMTTYVTAPIVAAAAASVASWRQVDAGMDIIVSKTGATGEALANLQQMATGIAETMPVSFIDAGDAVGELNTRFGLTGDELEDLSRQFLRFARVNGVQVSGTIDNVQKAMAAMNVRTDDASDFLDTLNAVGQSTGVDMNTLANELVANAAVLNDMGMSAADAAFFIGQLDKSGVESSTALTALKRAMINASAEGKTTSDAIAELQANLATAQTSAEGVNMVAELFGTRAAPAMYNALQNGTITFDQLGRSMGDFSGSVETTYGNMVGPMDEITTALNNLKELGYDMAQAWGPTLTMIIDTAVPVIQRITEAWQSLNPETQQTIINVALLAAAIGPILVIASKMIKSVQTIGGSIGSLTSRFASFGSSAASTASSASSAASSFSEMAGTALMLVALGAAVLMIAGGMKLLAGAAIELANAGPAAIAVFFGMVAAATAMAAVILLVGSSATVSAVGLLALGAAVLMISAGIALVVVSMTLFVEQLPVVASSGGAAASALLAITGAMAILLVELVATAAALAVMAAAALIAFVPFIAAAASIALCSVALVAFTATSALSSATALLLMAALVGVSAQLSSIESSSGRTARSLQSMVTAVNVVSSGLNGLASVARNAVSGFIDGISRQNSRAQSAGRELANNVVSGMDSRRGQFESAGRSAAQAFTDPIENSIRQLQRTFQNTSFNFNTHIALPHFTMTGDFNAQQRRVPNVGVRWYAKAATEGALFTKPTIIGVGDARQPEMLIGEEKLEEMLGGRGVTVNMTINGAQGQDVEELASLVSRRLQRVLQNRRAVFA